MNNKLTQKNATIYNVSHKQKIGFLIKLQWFILCFKIIFLFCYQFDKGFIFILERTIVYYEIPKFFYKKYKSNNLFWDKLSEYDVAPLKHYLNVLFPNVANKGERIERELFFDKNITIENEYVDENQQWPDPSYIMDPPKNQKIGDDVVPGIKDVQHLIYKHQHPDTCQNKKFMKPNRLYSGFGSINHLLGATLGQAIIEDRIFIYGDNSIVWNKGPYCGGDMNDFQRKYISRLTRRNHSNKERNFFYYQDGKKPSGFDCFYEPITNCSVDDRDTDNDVKTYLGRDNHIVPPFLYPILDRLKIPKDLAYYYWRLCATSYFYRENKLAKQWVDELEEDYLINPVDHYDVSIHLRHGEKSSEMKLVDGAECMGIIKIIKKLLNKDRLNIFVSSEDRSVIDWFLRNTNESITYFNFQLENFFPEQYTSLASVLVPQMLANMKHSIFATYVIGTIGSNWNRLLLELRYTNAGYANNYFFEVGNHPCVSLVHCNFLKKQFDMNW